jgi:tetrahydromethanopterin:alpha-L-glutamate ligase
MKLGGQGGGLRQQPVIAVMTDDPGWHGRRLVTAFGELGYAVRFISLAACSLSCCSAGGPRLPGLGRALPAAVFVRGVPGGTLPQVIHRLNILHELAACGVPVCNDGRTIERTVDKSMTTLLLLRAGIPTPRTWVGESRSEAGEFLQSELAAGHEVVLKPVFGSQGEGLQRLSSLEGLPPPEAVEGLYYLQRFVVSGAADYADLRVMVVAGRAIAAMRRSSAHWITNRAQGAACSAVVLDTPLAALAEDAVAAVGADYAGVDILEGRHGERLVCEVNGVPAWYGLQRATGLNLARCLAAHLAGRIGGGVSQPVAPLPV